MPRCGYSALTALVALAASIVAMAAAPPARSNDNVGTWTKTLLTDAVASGAVCLDGSPGAYYLRGPLNGSSSSAGFIIYFEGGGWCASLDNCYSRSLTDLGSSKDYPDVPPGMLPPGPSYEGASLFASEPFANFTVAYAKYCTGDSWTADNATVAVVNNTKVYFRGRRLLDALLQSLMPRGLATAPQVLVSGCSAGGLSAYTHVDYIASTLPSTTVVLGLADAMFALEHTSWPGPNTTTYLTGMFEFVASNFNLAANATGSASPGNAACLAHFGAANAVRCMWGATVARFVQTPMMVVNSKYDTWQEASIMGFDSHDCPATVDAKTGAITLCTLPEHANMTAFWVAYGDAMLDALAQLPPRFGAFITNCPAHCQTGNGWLNPSRGTVATLGEAVAAWYPQAVAHYQDPAWVAPRFVAEDADDCLVVTAV
jgi:hypothetical protein